MAKLAFLGLDPSPLLDSQDSFRFLVYQAIAEKSSKYHDMRDKSLAVKIANEVGNMLGLKK